MNAGRYLVIHVGKKWAKVDLFEIVALALNLSKAQVKRLDKQKGLDVYIEK